jgi:glycerate 2-kinase
MVFEAQQKESHMPAENTPDQFLRALFDKAVATADPMIRVADALPAKPPGRVVVIGAGKASARMAEAVEAVWGPCDGLVITRYGYARVCQGIEIVEAAHPVPDAAGAAQTVRLLELLETLGPDDFVLSLISGGGSALMIAPAGDITLAEKQAVNAALLASGAPIDRMNVVRKHLSRVKGGQLAAAAYPAQMLSLAISDVPGDDLAFIASGPTVGDNTTAADARALLEQWNIDVPPSVTAALDAGSGVVPVGDDRLSRVENVIIAAPAQSLDAAAEQAQAQGIETRMLGDALEGEARDLGAAQARMAIDIQAEMAPGDAPVLLLSGGECTVTRRGDGSGGPNAEAMLSAAVTLDGAAQIWALACDTDGVDGAAEVAGAVIGPDTLTKAAAAGLDPAAELANNNAHSFFAAIDDQVVTGPTLTNVNDYRAFLIYPADGGA